MKIQNRKNRLSKKIIFGFFTALLVLISWITYLSVSDTDQVQKAEGDLPSKYSPKPESPKDNINQQKTSNSSKNDNTQEIKDQSNTPKNKSLRKLLITTSDVSQYGDTVEIRAFANEVSNKATCMTNFSKGNLKISRNTSALPGATTTSCGSIDVPTSEFPEKGVWTVIVSYSSNSGKGTSKPAELTIR